MYSRKTCNALNAAQYFENNNVIMACLKTNSMVSCCEAVNSTPVSCHTESPMAICTDY